MTEITNIYGVKVKVITVEEDKPSGWMMIGFRQEEEIEEAKGEL